MIVSVTPLEAGSSELVTVTGLQGFFLQVSSWQFFAQSPCKAIPLSLATLQVLGRYSDDWRASLDYILWSALHRQ